MDLRLARSGREEARLTRIEEEVDRLRGTRSWFAHALVRGDVPDALVEALRAAWWPDPDATPTEVDWDAAVRFGAIPDAVAPLWEACLRDEVERDLGL